MAIYFSILNNKKYTGVFLVCLASLILLSKYNINTGGDDTYPYINTFLHFDSFRDITKTTLIYSASIDVLFWYPIYFLSLVTKEPNVFLFFCHFIALSILYYSYYKFVGKKAVLVFVLFLSTTTFYYLYGNAIRQALAVSFSVLFLYYLVNNMNSKALFISFISIFIHPTGLILFIVYLLSKLSIRFIYILLIFTLLLQFFPILNSLGNIFNSIGLSHLAEKAIGYSSRLESNSLINLSTVIFIFIMSIYWYAKSKLKTEILPTILIKVYVIYESLYLLFLSNSLISNRIFSYRGVLDILLIVIIITYFKQKNLLKFLFLFLFLLLNCINLISGGLNQFLYNDEHNLIILSLFDLFDFTSYKLERI